MSKISSLSFARLRKTTSLLVPGGAAMFLLSSIHAPAQPSFAATERAISDNPLLIESTLPYKFPPFDRIKSEDFSPAFTVALPEHLQEVEAIAANKEEPSFDNTIVALEKSGRTLDRVNNIFSNLTGAHTNPVLQKTEAEMAPKLAAHQDAILLNPALFARVQALQDRREQLGLDDESKYLLERYHKDFVRAGAKLAEPEKKKLKALNAQIATLETQFSQNVLKEKNAAGVLVNDKAELGGLSETEIAAAANAAKADKKEGKFLIALQNT